MCPRYFLILSEHCQLVIKEKDPPDCLIHILQIIENWTNLVATQNWTIFVSTRITILVATENWTNLVATRITILFATENWTDLVTTRITILFATENWPILVSTRITILVATENCPILCCDEIYFSLFSVCGDFLENQQFSSNSPTRITEHSTRITGFSQRIQ